jgi:hypothetical protein
MGSGNEVVIGVWRAKLLEIIEFKGTITSIIVAMEHLY